MDFNRINSILSNDDQFDVFYEDRPVWIQGISKDMAKVGFVDNFEEMDVRISELYEKQEKPIKYRLLLYYSISLCKIL